MKTQYFFIFISLIASACQSTSKTADTGSINETIYTNIEGKGIDMTIQFTKGEAHNHPTMAFWLEDLQGNYLQTIYITKSLATGTYAFGAANAFGNWKREPGEARRPATLPYYLHKRGVKAPDGTYLPTPDNPIPDVYSGATPKADFILKTKSDDVLPDKFRLLFEINQPWDWNEYWNNTKYPDDVNYKTSAQPALVYAVTIDLKSEVKEYYLNPIGHSHYSGNDGILYTDISSLTSALQIVGKIKVRLERK